MRPVDPRLANLPAPSLRRLVLALLVFATTSVPCPARAQCPALVAPTAVDVPATGAAGVVVNVTADSLCAWNVAWSDPWLANVTQSASAGNGTVTFDVLPNPGATRTANLLVASSSVAVTQASLDRQPLLDLYASTNGAAWTVNTGWGGPVGTECSWYGITCSADRVSQISLGTNNLAGTIPPFLGDLTSLLGLYLNGNALSGPIPATLGSLMSLQTLQLFQNGLTGPIPATLGNLYFLQSLDISRNQLSGPVPAEFGTLSSLTSLYIYSNALNGPLPASLSNLSGLTWVGLGYNALFSADGGLTAFLDAKQPGWSSTQTVAPTGVTAIGNGGATIQVSWTPITYTADPGYYEVLASTIPDNWTPVGTTASKSDTSLTVPAQPLWPTDFTVRAVTLPGPSNTNIVTSDDSAIVSASTLPCNYALANTGAAVGSPGGPGPSIGVSALADCGWNAGTNDSWITITGGAPGTGNGTIAYTVGANAGPARSGLISVTGTTNPVGLGFTVDQADGCIANTILTPASANVGFAAATGLNLNASFDQACAATGAVSNDGWITITGQSAVTGSANATYDVAANTGPARVGSITMQGVTFTVSQADGCAVTITPPTSASVPAAGGPFSFALTTSGASCPWTASSADGWITGITAGGTGSGSVSYTVVANTGPARTGAITVGGQTFTVNQADGCAVTITPPTSASVPAAGGPFSFALTTSGASCPWTASSADGWLTGITAGGTGSGTVSYTVAANTGPARTGTITAGGQTFTVNQADGCTVTITPPTSASVPAGGGPFSFALTTSGASCPWTASSADGWLTGITAGGTGSGTVSYTVAANTGPARIGTITAGGQTFTVNQADGCAASTTLNPVSASVAATGAAGLTFQVQTTAGCPWTAASNAPTWITVTAGSPGTGTGPVTYDVAANPGTARIGTITAGGQTFTVNQAGGCAGSTTLNPISASVAATGAAGQTFQVQTTAGCPWAAASNDPGWITVTAGSPGTGPGTVTYSVAANAGPARAGTITAGGQTFTVNQADGCLSDAVLVPTFTIVPAAGATGWSFALQTFGACSWTAASGDPWISITSGSSGTGNGTVTFDVAPNGGAARRGTITAAGQVFQVDQNEDCTATTSLLPSSASVPSAGTAGLAFQVIAGPSCPWTASPNASWIEVVTGSSGSGSATVTCRVAPNPGPARTGTITVASQTFSVIQADGCTAGSSISPASVDLPATAAEGLTIQVSTGAGCPWTATPDVPWILVTAGASGSGPGTVTYRVEANGPLPRTGTIAAAGQVFVARQASDCVAPERPRFTSYPTAPVVAGTTVTVAWAPVANIPSSGFYEVRLSKNRDCSAPTTVFTGETSFSFATEPGAVATYCAQVIALAGPACPPGLVSAPSEPVVVDARPLPTSFIVFQPMNPAARANRNEAPPTTSTVIFRNVGDSAGTLELSALGGFFSTIPPGPLEVPAGADGTVRIVFTPESTGTTGVRQGDLVGTWTAADGRKSVSATVALTVLEASSPSTKGMRLEPSGSDRVYFRHLGGNPDPQEIAIRNTGSLAVRITPAIGPGGSWLSISGDFTSPVPPGAYRTFQLTVDRSRRTSEDGPPPLSTGVRIDNVDGNPEDAARFEVFDEEPLPPEAGTDRPEQKEEEFSLILGSSVSTTTTGPAARGIAHTGAEYLSDGWIRNRGSDEVSVDLYYTPNGVNGLDDPRVKKNTVVLGGYGAYRMSDFVKGLFGETGSGQVEMRSTQLPQLSVRSTVDSITTRNGAPVQYGAELPLFVSGEGVMVATGTQTPEVAVLTGLKGPLAGFRSNVIFTETLGRWTEVKAALYDAGGRRLGAKTLRINPYSKVQVNYDDPELFAAPYAEASIELKATAGEGAVAALATVLDNASEGYVVRVATVLERPVASPATARTARAAAPGIAWIPTATREISTDSFYTTDLSVTNGTDADAALEVTYVPEAGFGDPVGPTPLLVPKRESEGGPKTVLIPDVLKTLMGIEASSRGMLRFEGPLADLVFSSETTTPIDPEKPELGRSLSSVSPAPGVTTKFLGVFSRDSLEAVGLKQASTDPVKQEVAHPSIEEGTEFRTDLVLAELAGQPATVRIKLRKTGGAALGDPLVVSLGANERKQIEHVILAVTKPPAGVVDFKGLEIAVEAVEGKGRTVALVTRVSTDPASRRTDTYVLGPPVAGSASRGGKK